MESATDKFDEYCFSCERRFRNGYVSLSGLVRSWGEIVQRRVVRRKIPIELDQALRKLQGDLKFQVGIDVTLINAGRAASKLLQKVDVSNPPKGVKLLKVVSLRNKSKRERVQFEV